MRFLTEDVRLELQVEQQSFGALVDLRDFSKNAVYEGATSSCFTQTSLLYLVSAFHHCRFSDFRLLNATTPTPAHQASHNYGSGSSEPQSVTLSGDGRFLAFESTFDLAGAGGNGFHALVANLDSTPPSFEQMGITRAVAPAISRKTVLTSLLLRTAIRSVPTLMGTQKYFSIAIDELFKSHITMADESADRISEGNFQPSISDDGGYVAFSSNRDLTGQNIDLNFEIFIYDTTSATLSQFTNTSDVAGASAAKISGNGNSIAYVRETATGQRSGLTNPNEPQGHLRVIASEYADAQTGLWKGHLRRRLACRLLRRDRTRMPVRCSCGMDVTTHTPAYFSRSTRRRCSLPCDD